MESKLYTGPESKSMIVALAQIYPEWLNRGSTLAKVLEYLDQAAQMGARLVVFSEALVPGYPFWLSHSGGAEFNSDIQKDIHARYLQQAVCIPDGHLDELCREAASREIAVYLGCVERAADRGGHSLYCSLIYINPQGEIRSNHRKLMPTYEERLVWAVGDGNGLQAHSLPPFTVTGLNCWENWMPLTRSAMYAQGTNLHIAVWPGGKSNTSDITRYIAKESRSFVLSASGLMDINHIPIDFPHGDVLLNTCPDIMADGGSCIVGPDGNWVIEPAENREELLVAELEYTDVLRERQNFDPMGHYSRPDVLRLQLDRTRQSAITYLPEDE